MKFPPPSRLPVPRLPVKTAINIVLVGAVTLLFIWHIQNDSKSRLRGPTTNGAEDDEQQGSDTSIGFFKSSSSSTHKCSQSFLIDEPKFEIFPDGDNWASIYLKKRKEAVESGEATLNCDLSLLETPLHFITVASGGEETKKFKIALHPPGVDSYVSEGMRKDGVPFENWLHPLFDGALKSVAKITKRSDKDKMLIIDAGGNVGAHSLYLAKLNHEVHTFEPFTKNMRLLRCSAQINKFTNLFLHRVALSNVTTATRMCLNAPEGNVAKNYDTSTDIRTIKLDDFWKVVLKRRRPIDVEGYEVKAFLGASEFLKTAPPYFVFSEIFANKLRDTGFDSMDYVNIMENAGYKTYVIHSMSPYVHGKESENGVDVVFVHKEILAGRFDDLK
ncbi:hypothetical protein HDU76_000741, partial [Blyttiomyces sp. JEL0837]